VAKDTEKLIRQLSLISFLMAQGRPVSALEIKREVEGYSDMNDDAFARRFYADRAELESLGIQLGVEKPGEGFFEAELYSLPPENFYLDAIKFSDDELAVMERSLRELAVYGGREVSEWSHEQSAGWNLAGENGNVIEYRTAFTSTDPLPAGYLKYASEYVRKRGWVAS